MFNNNLIPLYLYLGQPVPRPARLYDYIISAQGIIKRLETQYVSADQLLVPIETPLTGLRLADYPLQPVRFKLPRIPGQMLRDALADAEGVHVHHSSIANLLSRLGFSYKKSRWWPPSAAAQE